ncbi:MAG: hypothetical protein KAT70_04270 [Thermoplasmata archaeon]|nr:hypothetical protein [Thermoplasmata archaeon]
MEVEKVDQTFTVRWKMTEQEARNVYTQGLLAKRFWEKHKDELRGLDNIDDLLRFLEMLKSEIPEPWKPEKVGDSSGL